MGKTIRTFQIVGAVLMPLVGNLDAGEPTMQKNEWSTTHLFDKQAKPPFSFVYGGQPSERLLADWSR